MQFNLTHVLGNPEVYKALTKRTRAKGDNNIPRAILFEGPPGTGKTTAAKIIASSINAPLVSHESGLHCTVAETTPWLEIRCM